MRGALSFVIITLILSVSAQAKFCSKIDNRDDSLKEIRNQGGSDWCYAYAAADLLSYKLKKKISAVDLAYIYNQEDPGQQKIHQKQHEAYAKSGDVNDYLETDVNSGDAMEAINYAKKYGVCEEKYVPSNDKKTLDLVDSIGLLQQLRQAMILNPHTCTGLQDFQQGFRRYPNMNVMDLLNVAYKAHLGDLMINEDLKACEGHRVDISQIQTHIFSYDSRNPQTLDEALHQVDYSLEHKSIAAASFKFGMLDPKIKQKNDDHESIVVGREYNAQSKQCEYIVRNSLGSEHDKDSPLKNKDGYFWVPENRLRKYLLDVTTID